MSEPQRSRRDRCGDPGVRLTDVPGDPRDGTDELGSIDEPTLDEFYEQASCGYLSLNASGVIVRANETFSRWTGHPREMLLADQRFADLLTVGSRLYFETHCAPMLAAGVEMHEVALDVRRADGSVLLALLGATVHPGDDLRPTVVRLTVFDASQRRGFERHLLAERDAERQARHHAEGLGRIADRLASLQTVAQVGSALAGELVGGGFASAAELAGRGAGALPMGTSFTTHGDGSAVGVVPVRDGDGETIGTLRLECATEPSDAERAFFAAAAELAGRALGRVQHRAAVARATRAPATGGLPNERWWTAALKAEMKSAQHRGDPLTVVVVDIGQLDQITLSQGLGVADALLLTISDAWREAGYDLLSRFGGEEFAVLMPGVKASQAKAAAAQARRSAGARRHFTVGIAEWDGKESALSLMSRAEAALPTDGPAS